MNSVNDSGKDKVNHFTFDSILNRLFGSRTLSYFLMFKYFEPLLSDIGKWLLTKFTNLNFYRQKKTMVIFRELEHLFYSECIAK